MTRQFYIGLCLGFLSSAVVFGVVSLVGHHHTDELAESNSTVHTQPALALVPKQIAVEDVTKQPSSADTVSHNPGLDGDTPSGSSQYVKCDRHCSQTVLTKFLSGYPLSDHETDLLDHGSHHIAALVASNPDFIDAFKTSLLQNPLDRARLPLLRVIHHLPTDLSMMFVDELKNGSDNDRVNAVELLAMLSPGHGDIAQRIETSIQTETSPAVLVASIDALSSVAPSEISNETLSAISSYLRYSDDPAVQGKALETLTELQYLDNHVKQYIEDSLNSSSPKLQMASMHSLTNLLSHSERHTDHTLSASMQQRITEIANNTELPPDVRMQALSLIITGVSPD